MPKKSTHRIVIAAHAWSDDLVGGSFKVASDWARYLVRQGHDVHYLCGGDASIPHRRQVDGVQLWRYPYPARPGITALVHHLRHSRDCFREIRGEHDVDAIAGHSPLQYLGALSGGGNQIGTRMYCVHSPFVDEIAAAGRTWKNWPQRQLARQIDQRCIAGSTVVTTDSKYTLERLRALYGVARLGHGCVRSAWVDTERFQPVSDRRAMRRQLAGPWDTDLPILMTLRRLEPRMGLDRLVEAARIVRDSGSEFRLLIGGSGSMAESLRQQIAELELSESVFLLGRISDETLPVCYGSSDCFLLPTAALECFGLIILEAFACGVPVIATPVAAIPEIVTQVSRDWLTEDASATSLAKRIRMFLDGELHADPARLRQIAVDYHIDRRAEALRALLCLEGQEDSRAKRMNFPGSAAGELVASERALRP